MSVSRKAELEVNLRMVEGRIGEALRKSERSRDEITLVVVTKTFPVQDVQLLYELGVREFGENRDQEGSAKAPLLPHDAHWHFQGQIQSRKLPSILNWARTIHSIDSLEHARKIHNRGVSGHEFFLQVNCEEAAAHRGGVQVADIERFLNESPLHISGLMVVPPLDSDPRKIFSEIAHLAKGLSLQKISMGMSGDFEVAIEEGATHIRVGSSILGSRPLLA